MDIMNDMGIETKTIRAGHANLFLSPIFRQTLAILPEQPLSFTIPMVR